MKTTNKQNLPEVFVKIAESNNHEYKENRYSITELLLPTREIILNRLHANHIEVDVSDMIPAMFGTAIHKIFEEAEPENAEVKLELNLGEYTIVGVIDKLTDDAIEDYKTCSVSKIMRKDFDDWKSQGFSYAWMWFMLRSEIKRKFRVRALMKDWSKIKAASISDYPQSPIATIEFDIQDSDYDYVESWIKQKLKDIEYGFKFLPRCTDEERWYTGTKYAVYKKAGDARAAYVADNEDDAHNYITNKCGGAGEIQVRKGEYLKCKYYCNCNKYCKKGECDG